MADNDTPRPSLPGEPASGEERLDFEQDAQLDEKEIEANLSDDERANVLATRRFDLRRILGGLFVVYGVIVFITGFFTMTPRDLERAGGVPIDFWTGGAMFVLGLLFCLWDRLSPVPASDIVRSQRLNDEQAAADAEAGLVSKD